MAYIVMYSAQFENIFKRGLTKSQMCSQMEHEATNKGTAKRLWPGTVRPMHMTFAIGMLLDLSVECGALVGAEVGSGGSNIEGCCGTALSLKAIMDLCAACDNVDTVESSDVHIEAFLTKCIRVGTVLWDHVLLPYLKQCKLPLNIFNTYIAHLVPAFLPTFRCKEAGGLGAA
jgi:hypothetical protein